METTNQEEILVSCEERRVELQEAFIKLVEWTKTI